VRRVALRSRGYAQQDSVMPWRGYFLWIGGVLLLLLFAADGCMPRIASSGALTARVAFPPIRIRSIVKGPEAVVIVTTQASLPPASGTEVAAAVGSASPSPVSGDSLDQSAFPSTLQQAAADSSPSASAPAPATHEAFAQLVQPDRAVSREPKTARPAPAAHGSAQARIEARRQHSERLRHLACDWCDPSNPRQAF
jgi:hypothetical protein